MLDSSMTLDNQHTALGLLSQTSDKQGGLWVPTNSQTPRPHLSLSFWGHCLGMCIFKTHPRSDLQPGLSTAPSVGLSSPSGLHAAGTDPL